ncbi:hypothetical protein LXA47_03520 [Massilia sp. P8910]|nr:hypothetical protein [Massilia antarctica]
MQNPAIPATIWSASMRLRTGSRNRSTRQRKHKAKEETTRSQTALLGTPPAAASCKLRGDAIFEQYKLVPRRIFEPEAFATGPLHAEFVHIELDGERA